ncbi:hypothetical protein RCOM_0680670 [Ricinus communis]|uniref:DUF7952 domain-containing protein n=1 Tax=Ricinus communis TaxID=3988 RepID=B9RT33_RICCO|nr:hypothetical protein RCOM_0680670 [Ricinus communis]
MDVAQENQDWNCTEDEFAEESLYPEALGISDGFRDPELLPRIGEQYQVEIPPLMANWPTGKELIKHEGIRDLHIFPKCELEVKTQPMDITLHGVTEVRVPANLDLQEERQTYMHQQHGGKDYFIVPGSAGGTWSGLEEASFLLGLYIFGKNLVQVKKFVDSKKMGDILSFYYGKFYRSESYNRWSECRKMRSRRCIYGQRIFTGSTQQELLSRLFLHVSEECQNTLTEVAKKFGEGNMLLEEYVFTLKSTVGLNALVEAVGIGKRKQDLTGMALEPLRSNQVAAVRPEIPVGKACSILTPLEIINFLTGGYRDVLNKVASDPGLLELNIGEDKGCDDKEENGWANEKILDQGEFSDQQRHCYLKPRTPSRSKEVMKFTVVDTSLATGETNRVRELRSLAIELMNVSTSRSDSEESDEDPFQDTRNVSDSSANLCSDRNKTDILKSSKINEDKRDSSPDRANFEINALEHSSPIIGSNFTKKIPKEQKAGKYDDMRPTKSIKGHAIKKTKPGDMNFLAPVAKRRRRVAACNKAAKVCNKIDSMLRQDEVICTSSYPLMEEKVSSCLDPYQVKISSASSSSRGSPNITDECTLSLSSNSSVAEHTNENYQSRTLIDLNISFPQDAETEPLIMEMTERVHDQASEQPEDSGMLKTSTSICNSSYEQAPSMNSRRQSTRNRPLTTKALEALAFGFLSIKQKRRDREDYATGNSLSRPSRRARSRMRITENFAAGVIDSKGDEKANGVCKGNGNIFSIQG